ncbi:MULTISPECIES: response regulator transcription factor [unclassified Salinibacterium]|uniref:response regulator transcription factor n=1 Tax=unclassified Salinibacterium TaxID=2632331 RepID=UPI00141F3F17|nr:MULTISPECIES: response regulator transcription factor [unclassified Salinibacterium]
MAGEERRGLQGAEASDRWHRDGTGTKVFVVNAREITRRGLRALLDEDPDIEVVGEAESLASSVRDIVATHPDVAIIDVAIPANGPLSGEGARGEVATVVCVTFGRSDDEKLRRAAQVDGSSAYLSDDVGGRILREIVRRVARGEPLAEFSALASRVEAEDAPRLTMREHDVLRLIALGLTNKQIGERLGLSEKTVKNYVSGLFSKLHIARRAQAAVYQVTHSEPLGSGGTGGRRAVTAPPRVGLRPHRS